MSLLGRLTALSLHVVEEVPPDIQRKYRRTSPTSWACRTCGSNVESVTVQRASSFALDGFEDEVVPYCPKCEPVPVDEGPPRPQNTRDTSWDP